MMLPPSDLSCNFTAGCLARPYALLFLLSLGLFTPFARAADAGTVTGTVTNTTTGSLLEGARIEVPRLGLSALTDNTGRFVLTNVPAGTHELVTAYIGLDPVKSQVTVGPGERAVRNFELTTDIYKLEAFRVTGEREGGAAAITAQRNAPNLTNVIAMDSYGNLPNMSIGEVVMRLPGVAGSPNDEGSFANFSIRGMAAGLNTVTIDGGFVSTEGTSRALDMRRITGAIFDQLELIKGHTPDKGANSLGGTVNLKTRSPFKMREKRRINYNFSTRMAPSFTEQIPLREEHRAHPLLTLGYQEIFDVLGGSRNVAVNVNMFYSEDALGFFQTTRDFQNTTGQPAYVWDYRTFDNYNNSRQASINMRADYQLSPRTRLSITGLANDYYQKFRRRYVTRAFTGNQNVVPGATSGIVPGFTDRITRVRATPGSTIEMTMTGPNNWMSRMRQVGFAAEHDFGRLQIDYDVRHARTSLNNGNGQGGVLVNRITNVGWILERTDSDMYPRFIQTEGPDFTDPANYRPAPTNALTNADNQSDQRVRDARGNARYLLPIAVPIALKTGAQVREILVQQIQTGGSRRWNYVATGPLPVNPSLTMFDEIKTGRRMPQWEASMFISDRTLIDPSLWAEDVYYREQLKYTGTKQVSETVTAGYVMAEGKLGRQGWPSRTGFLTGVRTEKTDNDSWGWVRRRFASTAAEQRADPVGAAKRDYDGTRREMEGSYTKSFPSTHLTHDFTPNLRSRLAWSTSFGRPGMNNLLPNESVNEANQTITVNNPSLLPQMATNWDATLDYYFEPVGNLSVGWFHKKIKDYIVSGINTGTVGSGNDNGYNGDYAGFARLTTANAGTATVQGWEFSYQQQFAFLPGLLKGLSGSANYTLIDTHGDFGGREKLSTGQVVGFIPRVANLSLSWRYKGFSTRVLYNYTGSYIVEYSSASVGRNRYRQKFKTVHLGAAYQLRPAVTLTCDVANLTNTPQVWYRGVPGQMQSTIINGIAVSAGVTGRF